jgi:predicted RNA methylase
LFWGLLMGLLAPTIFDSRADFREEIPFIPTPIGVVDQMLELAEVKKADVVYDLGSGDGRIVIRAAKKYGARAVGIEIDRELIAQSRKAAKTEGVSHLVEFRSEDALKADLSPATVVTLYMLPWFNAAVRPNLQKMLKPGARICDWISLFQTAIGNEKVEKPRIEAAPSEQGTDNRLLYKLLLPALDISAAAPAPQPAVSTSTDSQP